MNTRHKVLDCFGPSCGVIAIHSVLMYYAILIGSSLFLAGSFGGFRDVLDVDLSSLFVVGEPPHKV
jgi:hypothetical protein